MSSAENKGLNLETAVLTEIQEETQSDMLPPRAQSSRQARLPWPSASSGATMLVTDHAFPCWALRVSCTCPLAIRKAMFFFQTPTPFFWSFAPAGAFLGHFHGKGWFCLERWMADQIKWRTKYRASVCFVFHKHTPIHGMTRGIGNRAQSLHLAQIGSDQNSQPTGNVDGLGLIHNGHPTHWPSWLPS